MPPKMNVSIFFIKMDFSIIADLEAMDPEKSMSVNIGLPVASAKTRMTRTDMRTLKKERNMVALEKLSRDRKREL